MRWGRAVAVAVVVVALAACGGGSNKSSATATGRYQHSQVERGIRSARCDQPASTELRRWWRLPCQCRQHRWRTGWWTGAGQLRCAILQGQAVRRPVRYQLAYEGSTSEIVARSKISTTPISDRRRRRWWRPRRDDPNAALSAGIGSNSSHSR